MSLDQYSLCNIATQDFLGSQKVSIENLSPIPEDRATRRNSAGLEALARSGMLGLGFRAQGVEFRA